jgi:hypothetical protein
LGSGLPTGVRFDDNIFLAMQSPAVNCPSCAFANNIMFPQSLVIPNNLIMDPKLADPPGGDFHLKPGSPAIDAADATPSPSIDFDGTARPQGPRADIGAFESHP